MIHFNCPNCGRHYEVPEALAGLPLVCKQCGQRMNPPAVSTAAPPPPPKVVAPPPPTLPAPAPKPAVPVAPSRPVPAPKAEAAPADEDVLVAQPDSTPDIDFNIGGPTAASLSDAARARPAGFSKNEFVITPPPAAAEGKADEPEFDLDRVPLRPPPGAEVPPPEEPVRAEPKAGEKPVIKKPEREPQPPAEPEAEEARASPAILPFVLDAVAFVLLVVAGLFVGELLAHKPTGEVLEGLAAPKFPPVDLILWAAPAALFALVYLLLANRGLGLGSRLRAR